MVDLRASSLEARVGENFDVSLTPGDFIPIVGAIRYSRRTKPIVERWTRDLTFNESLDKAYSKILGEQNYLLLYNFLIGLGGIAATGYYLYSYFN